MMMTCEDLGPAKPSSLSRVRALPPSDIAFAISGQAGHDRIGLVGSMGFVLLQKLVMGRVLMQA